MFFLHPKNDFKVRKYNVFLHFTLFILHSILNKYA